MQDQKVQPEVHVLRLLMTSKMPTPIHVETPGKAMMAATAAFPSLADFEV